MKGFITLLSWAREENNNKKIQTNQPEADQSNEQPKTNKAHIQSDGQYTHKYKSIQAKRETV